MLVAEQKSVVRLRAFSGITHMAYENVLKNPDDFNFEIEQLGEASHSNPAAKRYLLKIQRKLFFQAKSRT